MVVDRATRSVLVERANGPALFEIRRICDNDIRVDVDDSPTATRDRIATIRNVGEQRTAAIPPLTNGSPSACTDVGRDRPLPTILVSLDAVARWQLAPHTGAEHFTLSQADERLALLARLASLCQHEPRGRSDDLGRTRVYEQVAMIQRSFRLRLTERELSDRVGIDPATLRRWYRRVGALTPKRAMCWVRMHELALRIARRAGSIGLSACELGLSSPANVRRTLKRLTGLSPKSLRQPAGLAHFVAQMKEAFNK